MENNDTHWGEMPERQGFSSEFVSSDQVNLLILKAMKADPLKVYQPCEQEELGLYEMKLNLKYLKLCLQCLQFQKNLKGYKHMDLAIPSDIWRRISATSYYILDTLTDIAEEYIQKFTQLLRVTIDQEAMTESTGFADAMERVFHDMGEGSMITLHEFYQCSTSEIDNEEDIPEIHFPALGEGYSADELQPSLEPGFQMLHSLEQEEQLQNLETEEEINVSDSPNQDLTLQGTSMDSQQTPNPNKSRKKKKKMNEGNIGI
ncbi:hypothetical protein C0J52_05620 [Blattella germanica]|nr:hypothetical protein C0J52_05620 [Blattella germanica]